MWAEFIAQIFIEVVAKAIFLEACFSSTEQVTGVNSSI
jgi:hypothetical protein